ncbi:hypothetical protein CHRYSEOSP005_24830 [Chryseobacterium sp. Alg-005]|uniref:helix-turn-helix domain-containing protein n=1 Tax=Chryseobacterium sp. Alg-005 TaxID=3159516 RepID=UPI0035559CB8
MQRPDYKLIYSDLISKKHPDKKEKCEAILQKKELSVLDVIVLNKIISPSTDKEVVNFNQKFRSYDKNFILRILDYQKKHRLSNVQLARRYNLSRNTVAKWKKCFY